MSGSMAALPERDEFTSPHLSHVRNVTAEDCQFSEEISTSSLIQILRMVQILVCTMGLSSSVLFIYALRSQAAHQLHVNIRLSLISLTAGAILACCQIFFIAAYNFVRTLKNDDACEFMVDVYVCALLRFPILLAIYATILGSMVIAAERAIATVHFKTYESHGSVFVGITLIAFQWTIALGITLMVAVARMSPGSVHYCSIYIARPRSALYSITVVCVLETVTMLLSMLLLKVNQRKKVTEFINNSLHSLTERYQLQENIRMMQILVPTMTVHAMISVLCLTALLLFAYFENTFAERSAHGLAPFSEFVLLFISAYGFVFPIFALFRNQQLRLIAKRALPTVFGDSKKTHDLQGTEEQSSLNEYDRVPKRGPRFSKEEIQRESDRHFGLLSEMWAK